MQKVCYNKGVKTEFCEVFQPMILYTNNNYISDAPCVVALGCFDGVHIGHRAVIEEAIRTARESGLASAVWTFSEPPKNFFAPGSVQILSDREEKCRRISLLGVDLLFCIDFDAHIAALSPEKFFSEIVLKQLNARHVVCGFNYTFGAKSAGNTALLRELCEEHGIKLTVLDPVTSDGVSVSSSLIRSHIENGEMESAQKYLGYPYTIVSRVVDGQKLARRLGFPTVNLIPSTNTILPKNGVYVSRIDFEGNERELFGITNIGMRPTVKAAEICAETHIFDFNGDLYGKELRVELLHFVRAEQLFDSIDELREQVHSDISAAKDFITKK